MKKLMICLLVCSLVGCAQFNNSDLRAAEYVCRDKGGVERFTYELLMGPEVHCYDTSTFHKLTAARKYREYIKLQGEEE